MFIWHTSNTRSCNENGASSESSAKPWVISFSENTRTLLVARVGLIVAKRGLAKKASAEYADNRSANVKESRRWSNICSIFVPSMAPKRAK